MSIYFKTIIIIGVGLIGGSFARVCKKKGLTDRIIGFGRGEENLKRAVELNVIDSYALNIGDAVRDSDFILLAAPVSAIIEIARDMIPYLKKGAIVTDAGSVKGEIVRKIDKILPEGIFFVGAHPIAGTEKSGVEASFAELFEGSRCVITPTSKTDPAALEKVKEIWKETGSEVILMDADKHDRYLAAVSHLPHAVAYALVNAVGNLEEREKGILSLSAGGFRDFTRIAASHPAMWRDIFLMNKREIVEMINIFKSTLENIKEAIVNGDGGKLKREFEKAREIKFKIQNSKFQIPNLQSSIFNLQSIIVAIDGPAGSGKSTIAKMMAEKLKFRYIDTGAMYRTVALKAIKNNIPLTDEKRVSDIAKTIEIEFQVNNNNQSIYMDGENVTLKIRDENIGKGASIVSAYSDVRNAMLLKQREMGKSGGIVMEGRDIGTVVFPDAHIKFFLDASVEERGRRRFIELKEKGEKVTLDKIITDIKKRDKNDTSRNLAPLKRSDDSIVIDTTGISIDGVVKNMLQIIDKGFRVRSQGVNF
ncbi:MAG: cytidylate kinase [Nitrospinae bacterium RIFCSPLOWO2_02_39_17]|nr:MAG: cytidylate kinase [Nitrospinae bacterium RIFCSPHIGHO2_02_39_11]OGV98517.1 MAG: cytidylate kinase [Nitrospinae bacterium RIFCSPHIGHO2_12_FULL_39_42]OGW07591.1 MAG: cytidylate kinase [Nitrospinae bacterium RIFCSPLOWO2_02_39_17]OGW09275.1 MAG: cytidylate kinase [Nitrospinae bacterium RIFCSPLOWO2_12_39_15]